MLKENCEASDNSKEIIIVLLLLLFNRMNCKHNFFNKKIQIFCKLNCDCFIHKIKYNKQDLFFPEIS